MVILAFGKLGPAGHEKESRLGIPPDTLSPQHWFLSSFFNCFWFVEYMSLCGDLESYDGEDTSHATDHLTPALTQVSAGG